MLTCMHPGKGYVCADTNVYSTVLFLRFGTFTALLTGDLEGEGESMLIQGLRERGIEDITLLKAAHHGSKNSTSQEFVERTAPRMALISAGRHNAYGHPHKETLKRLETAGCRVYQTPASGAVTVRVRRGKVWVEEYLAQ